MHTLFAAVSRRVVCVLIFFQTAAPFENVAHPTFGFAEACGAQSFPALYVFEVEHVALGLSCILDVPAAHEK